MKIFYFGGVCPTLCERYSIVPASAPRPAAERTEKGTGESGALREGGIWRDEPPPAPCEVFMLCSAVCASEFQPG